MKNKLKNNIHSIAATILGLLTSVATALAIIDFDTFDFNSKKDLFKLFVIAMPAVGGYLSKIKETDTK